MDRPNRMELQSADGAQLNLDALYQIAPSCFTEVAAPACKFRETKPSVGKAFSIL